MATITLKITEKCNSNCIYCDIVKKPNPKSISLSLLEHIFINFNDFLLARPNENINLTWNGGEPLLLGEEFFIKAFKFQEKHCSNTKNRIIHSIQSNILLLNEKFIEIFKKFGIKSIGTSFDAIANIRGPGLNRDSKLYNSKFFKAINLLEKNSLNWGLIYVVTKKSLNKPLDLFFLLSNMKKSDGFKINTVIVPEDEQENIGISPREFADFLGAVFPVWWKYKDRYPLVDPFKTFVNNLILKTEVRNCEESGRCAYNHVYINPDGKASQCRRASDWDIISYGNIKERSLLEILEDKRREKLNERNDILFNGECMSCKYWKICHGGCPLDSYAKYKDYAHKTDRCEGKKIFIEKYFIPLTGIKSD